MPQFRFWNYRADDRTADLNYYLLGERPPGVYYGYDFVFEPGEPMTLVLSPGSTAFNGLDENGDPWLVSIAVTKQGVKIVENEAIRCTIGPTGVSHRIDAVILEHEYTFDPGGEEALFSVIAGVPGSYTTPTIPPGAILIGTLYVPASTTALNGGGVLWTRSLAPNFAGKQIPLITSPNDTVEVVQSLLTEKTVINDKVRLGISDANTMLQTGKYFKPAGYGTNYPNALACMVTVYKFNDYIEQMAVVSDGTNIEKFNRITLDDGATWTSWVSENPVSKNGSLFVSKLDFADPSFPGRVNIELNVVDLGDFAFGTEGTIEQFIKDPLNLTSFPTLISNPFKKLLPTGNYKFRLQILGSVYNTVYCSVQRYVLEGFMRVTFNYKPSPGKNVIEYKNSAPDDLVTEVYAIDGMKRSAAAFGATNSGTLTLNVENEIGVFSGGILFDPAWTNESTFWSIGGFENRTIQSQQFMAWVVASGGNFDPIWVNVSVTSGYMNLSFNLLNDVTKFQNKNVVFEGCAVTVTKTNTV